MEDGGACGWAAAGEADGEMAVEVAGASGWRLLRSTASRRRAGHHGLLMRERGREARSLLSR